MVCYNCGQLIPNDSEFCQYCGKRIGKNVEEDIAIDKLTDTDEFDLFDLENATPEEILDAIIKIQEEETADSLKENIKNQSNNEDDIDFGLIPQKPIYTLANMSVDGEREYLNQLYTEDGDKIRWKRRGSISVSGVGGMIDIYDTYLSSCEPYKTIYINMYGSKKSEKAPKGFMLNKSEAIKEHREPKKGEKVKSKYIIWVLLILVFALSLYIFGSQDNKIEKLSKSVLMLNIYDTKNELSAIGSGFVAFENDVLVTNYHVIDKAYKIEAVDENDVVYSLDKVVAFDEEKDLAILKFSSPTKLKTLKLYDSSKISKGDEVTAIGSPEGLKNTVSKGIISSVRKDDDVEIFQISAPISSGSSGGALLSEKGEAIGVTFAGMDDGQNLNFAIPSNEIVNLYNNKSGEQNVQDFFFEQNPIEKYKLECIQVTFDDIYNNPGIYHRENVCLKGYVSSFQYSDVYIVENYDDITNNGEFDHDKSLKDMEYRIVSIFNKDDYGKAINDDLQVGDYIVVYGNLYDDIHPLWKKSDENWWHRSISDTIEIEVIQR